MIKFLVKLANIYDRLGQTEKADRLDAFLDKYAQEDREPTPEDLLAEEEWLKEEIDPEEDEDILEDLEESDREVAESYLSGTNPEDIMKELQEVKKEQKEILRHLSELMMHQNPPAEASLAQDFQKLADLLDQHKMHRHADVFDKMLTKMAQGLPPDDDFESSEFPGSDSYEDLDDFPEPSTEELMKLEEETKEETIIHDIVRFLEKLRDSEFLTLDEAEDEAELLLREYDEITGFQDPKPEIPMPEPPLPENVLQFPKKV